MKKVVISHRLHDDGMAVLEKAGVNVAITNDGSPKAMLPELLDAEGLIIRIGSIDRDTMLAAGRLVGGKLSGLQVVTKAGAFGSEKALVLAIEAIRPDVKKEEKQ